MYLRRCFVAGNAQATINVNIKPLPGDFPSSEEIDKPMNQQDPGAYAFSAISLWNGKTIRTQNRQNRIFGKKWMGEGHGGRHFLASDRLLRYYFNVNVR